MTKPPLPAATQASRVSIPASATTPAPAMCPTTTRPSPACSACAVQQRGRYPCCEWRGGGGGGNFWDHAVTATLASHHSHCRDTATSTTTEHFKPFLLPDGRSLLPRHVHQPESGYLQESSLFLPPHRGGDSPAHAASPGPPRASREHGTESRRAGPAQPGMVLGVSVVLGPALSPGGFGVSVIPGLGPTPGGFGGVGGLPCPTSPTLAHPQTQGDRQGP